jgi:hypothetical protein
MCAAIGAFIKASYIHLCMLRGTCVNTGHDTSRHYYKGLCVLARGQHSARRSVVASFWTPAAHDGKARYEKMLRQKLQKGSKKGSKRQPASSKPQTLLMLRA